MNTFLAKLLDLLRAVLRRPLLLIASTIVIVAIMFATRPQLAPVDLPERVWPVEVVTVEQGDEQPVLELFGEVVAGRRSELRALVPGSIVEVGPGFREGGFVEAGELLVQIDPFDYRNNVAEQTALLAEAQASLETRRRDLARVRELYAENNISEQALDDAQLAVEQQQATLEQRRIGLERAKRALRDSRLTAPYAGVLSGVSVDLGKRLSVNDKVADVIDTARLEVFFTLSNAQFGRIIESGEQIVGRPIEVFWQVGNDTLSYQATVERVGAEIDSTTGGVVLYATIDPDAQTLLRPGAFVRVRMPDKKYPQVFRVPESALYGSDTVYAVKDNRLAARTVTIAGYAGDDVLFTSRIEPLVRNGDQVVITQIREGGEGVKVEVR
jgi:RND family efflux transporter MFP subunit